MAQSFFKGFGQGFFTVAANELDRKRKIQDEVDLYRQKSLQELDVNRQLAEVKSNLDIKEATAKKEQEEALRRKRLEEEFAMTTGISTALNDFRRPPQAPTMDTSMPGSPTADINTPVPNDLSQMVGTPIDDQPVQFDNSVPKGLGEVALFSPDELRNYKGLFMADKKKEAQDYLDNNPKVQKYRIDQMKSAGIDEDVAYKKILGSVPKTNAEKISAIDSRRIDKSQTAADTAAQAETKLTRIQQILGRYRTGLDAKVIGASEKFLDTIGLTNEDRKQRVADYEELTALSKELGAETLQLFGGSDTDKELQVAIATNPNEDNTIRSNINIVNRKLRAAQIIQARPEFETQWVNEYGSLKALNSAGETFGKAWRNFQKDTFKETADTVDSATQDNNEQSSSAQAIKAKVKAGEMSREEAVKALRELGFE